MLIWRDTSGMLIDFALAFFAVPKMKDCFAQVIFS